MNHALLLSLELLEQAAWGFRFRVTVRNDSAAKLFLPFPEVTSLRFAPTMTMQEAEWYTGSLVSASGGGFALLPTKTRSFEWRVRPCSVERPAEAEDFSDWEYRRWCVDIQSGEYLVWYQWRVDDEYFDPDSHMRLPDLERAAARERAVVWLGEVLSNRVQLVTPK